MIDMNFLDSYNHTKNERLNSFKFALQEATLRKHKIFVETGTARGKKKFLFFLKKNWKDGMSTLLLSNYADNVRGHLYSCDIDEKNINNAMKFTKKFKKSITFINDDSLNFLKNFQKKIDFLYLDSLDAQYSNASEHQLNEIKNSIKILHKNSLILLDDKGQKTNLSKNYMLDNGLIIINETEQQILFSS